MAQAVTKENFQQEVLESQVPVLVDFWATWCGPCRMLNPVLEELSSQGEGKYKIVKVDVDEAQDLASDKNVSAIPTLVVYKNGQETERFVGLQAKEKLLSALT